MNVLLPQAEAFKQLVSLCHLAIYTPERHSYSGLGDNLAFNRHIQIGQILIKYLRDFGKKDPGLPEPLEKSRNKIGLRTQMKNKILYNLM